MYRYSVKSSSRGPFTVEAKNAAQAKQIVCRMLGISPSDYWCGVSCFTAKRLKEAEA